MQVGADQTGRQADQAGSRSQAFVGVVSKYFNSLKCAKSSSKLITFGARKHKAYPLMFNLCLVCYVYQIMWVSVETLQTGIQVVCTDYVLSIGLFSLELCCSGQIG